MSKKKYKVKEENVKKLMIFLSKLKEDGRYRIK